MFVKIKQTRHTKIGTLRPGVYERAKLGADGAKVIKALMDAEDPSVQEISKKEAAAELAKVKSLMPNNVQDLKIGAAASAADPAADPTSDQAADDAAVAAQVAKK